MFGLHQTEQLQLSAVSHTWPRARSHVVFVDLLRSGVLSAATFLKLSSGERVPVGSEMVVRVSGFQDFSGGLKCPSQGSRGS